MHMLISGTLYKDIKVEPEYKKTQKLLKNFLIPYSQHPGHKVWAHKRKKFTKKMCSSPYPKRTCFFAR
jgi:hypothetical protein